MNRQHWLRPLRIIVATVFLTGFVLLFSDVRARIPTVVYEVFTSFQFLPSLLKFLVMPEVLTAGFIIITLLTLFTGRIYCSVFCPLGIMQDAIAFIRRQLPFKQRRRKFRKALNFIRYPILGLTAISLFFTGILAIIWLDPYANFGRIATNLYQPVFISAQNLISRILMGLDIYAIQALGQKVFYPLPFFASLSVFLLILILVIYRDRLYCNTVCPIGSLLGLLSKVSFLKLKIEKSSCTSCGKCQLACKADCISIKNQSVDETRCVSCFNCINVCEGKSIRLVNSWKETTKGYAATDKTKRDFLKAGMLAIGSIPLAALAGEGQETTLLYSTHGPISPPGSLSIDHLKEKCIGCQLCISSCPSKVLQPTFLEYGFTGMMLPQLVNSIGFCNYECTICSRVCPTGALVPLTTEEKKTTQLGRVFFDQDLCVVKTKEKACGSCSEHCPTQAVHMIPYKDFLTIPETNADICVGCGACEYACPVDDPHVAIFVIPNKVHQKAKKPVTEKVVVKETDEFPF